MLSSIPFELILVDCVLAMIELCGENREKAATRKIRVAWSREGSYVCFTAIL